jgi:hypothetical protein
VSSRSPCGDVPGLYTSRGRHGALPLGERRHVARQSTSFDATLASAETHRRSAGFGGQFGVQSSPIGLEFRLGTKTPVLAGGGTGVRPGQLAVAAGFEPAEGCPSRAFEARSLGRSDTPPPERLPRRCHDTSRFHDRAAALLDAYLRTRPQMFAESAIFGVVRGLVRRNGAGVVRAR